MKDRPILMSGPMVRAILDGRKTQTRRVVKPQPILCTARGRQIIGDEFHEWPAGIIRRKSVLAHDMIPKCPYGTPGDRLWVRETWRKAYAPTSYSSGLVYRSDAPKSLGMDEYSDRHRWNPSIHMPRRFCRLVLEVTAVRVERVQEISAADAVAEGVREDEIKSAILESPNPLPPSAPIGGYRWLWDSLNAKRGYGWKVNPWVWVIEFKRVTS